MRRCWLDGIRSFPEQKSPVLFFFIWDNCRWRVLAKINEIKKRNGKKVPPRRFWVSNQNFLLRQKNRGRIFFTFRFFSASAIFTRWPQKIPPLFDLDAAKLDCSGWPLLLLPDVNNAWLGYIRHKLMESVSTETHYKATENTQLIELYKLASLNLWPGFLSRIELEPTLQSCYFPVFSVKLVPAVLKVPDSGSSKN